MYMHLFPLKVCSHHDPHGVLHLLQRDHRLTGGFLDSICRCRHLKELELTHCFMVHHTALEMISVHCTLLDTIKLSGTDVDDIGIAALATNLKAIHTLHVRAARNVSDESLDILVRNHAMSLRDLDVTRCCLITKEGCLRVVEECVHLEALSIACGVKRGGWLWTMNDQIAECILKQLKGLRKLEYVTADNGTLEPRQEMKLWNIDNIVIQRITTSLMAEMNGSGRFSTVQMEVDVINAQRPLLMERIVGGQVVYSHRFRR